ncbi:MAG: integration host factor subunit alpha [Rhodobacteraceae bacterium]|jgi:integration host factor subunit alpha|nr:integration host factor subunit alpha [Paracoccaceae bacterium]PWL19969.1 MAG: integration host factor subunit alpha [Candidatus Aquiluna sp. XM-24bin5]
MAGRTLTRVDIAEAVARKCDLRKPRSAELVDNILDAIMDGLVEDGIAKLSGFANFTVRSKQARVGRNPKTGVKEAISARKVVVFKASQNMKSIVDAGNKAQLTKGAPLQTDG